MLLVGAVFAKNSCQAIADTIKDLQIEVADLQLQLQNADTSEKPYLASQIKKLNGEIAAKKLELSKCLALSALSASPGGGEAFSMQGGEILSAADVKQSIVACPPPSPLSPFQPQAPPPPLNASPAPTAGWRAESCVKGNPADAQIAVSTTHVVVTFENSMAWYDKNGNKQGELFRDDLFNPLLSTLAPGGKNSCSQMPHIACASGWSDMRALFDPYRHRFWVLDHGHILAADRDPYPQKTMCSQPVGPCRRGIFLLAVSQTEDPKDGWYLYWWDELAHWGKANDPVWQAGDGADYPAIGIDSFGFYQTNKVARNGHWIYIHVALFRGEEAAKGIPAPGWHYFDLTNPDNQTNLDFIQPVIHHDYDGRTYFVSKLGPDQALVWALTNPLQPSQDMQRVAVTLVNGQGSVPFNSPQDAPELKGKWPIRMTNLNNDILKAAYRSGDLVFVANDAQDHYHDGTLLSSIRLVRLRVLGFPNIPTLGDPAYINTRFGNVSWDDHPGDRMHGGWPAVEVNKNSAIAVVYARSGATVDPEVRYNALFDNDADIRPSRLLKAGDAAYAPLGCYTNEVIGPCRWGDTAGAAVDPQNDTSIWLAQQYANSEGGWDIWVAKVF
jgi:hypothetical protein